jgi:hypothetical protein
MPRVCLQSKPLVGPFGPRIGPKIAINSHSGGDPGYPKLAMSILLRRGTSAGTLKYGSRTDLVPRCRNMLLLLFVQKGEPIMQLSARNQIKGTVSDVKKGATTAHVKVDIGGG